MLETPSALTLQTLLATHSNTAAIKSGVLESPLVNFVFADVKVANRAFKPLVREQKFDLGELAIVTYLQAKAFWKKITAWTSSACIGSRLKNPTSPNIVTRRGCSAHLKANSCSKCCWTGKSMRRFSAARS